MNNTKPQEFTGKTVDKAVRAGLKSLGLTAEATEVDVIDSGSRGFLGLFGTRDATVVLRPKPDAIPSQVRAMASEVLRLMGLTEAKVSARQTGGSVRLAIDTGDENGLLIGRGGETLRALEHVLTRMAQRQTFGGRSMRVFIDIGGYRRGGDLPSSGSSGSGHSRKRRPRRRSSS